MTGDVKSLGRAAQGLLILGRNEELTHLSVCGIARLHSSPSAVVTLVSGSLEVAMKSLLVVCAFSVRQIQAIHLTFFGTFDTFVVHRPLGIFVASFSCALLFYVILQEHIKPIGFVLGLVKANTICFWLIALRSFT